MRRREFIAGLGGAAAWPLAARAQQGERVRRIGVLIGGAGSDPVWQGYVAVIREELATLGWVENRNLLIDLRFGDSDANRIRAQAAELVGLAPEVILTASGTAARATQQATQKIPIIAVGVPTAMLPNIARPGGNITGFPILYPSIGSKWLELLKEVAPRLTRVAFLSNADLSGGAAGDYLPSIEAAAKVLGAKVIDTPFRDVDELEHAIEAFAAEPNGGLIIRPSAGTATYDSRQSILRLATLYRLPVIHWDKSYPAEGGLMSYGSNFGDLHRRAASYVDRILRGAKVIDLPAQYPTKFDLVINLKAAKTIGLAIPESFLPRADEVIE
jgi:putative tryptophan/tyrosine transport system substrate-binding protein